MLRKVFVGFTPELHECEAVASYSFLSLVILLFPLRPSHRVCETVDSESAILDFGAQTTQVRPRDLSLEWGANAGSVDYPLAVPSLPLLVMGLPLRSPTGKTGRNRSPQYLRESLVGGFVDSILVWNGLATQGYAHLESAL